MTFKNLLLGLGGSAAIGGIGYGIYASSQSNNEEKPSNRGSEEVKKPAATGSKTNSGHDNNEDNTLESPSQNDDKDPTIGGADGASGEKSSTSDKTPTGTEPAT